MAIHYLPRISLVAGSTQDFIAGDTYILQEYISGDFDGIKNNHSTIISDTSGTYTILDLSAVGDLTIQYIDCQDIHVINGTITCQGGIDNGGNDNIVFLAISNTSIHTTLVSNSETVDVIIMDGNGANEYITYLNSSNNLIFQSLFFNSENNIVGTSATFN